MAFDMKELGKEVLIADSGIYTRLDRLPKNMRGITGYLSKDTLFIVPAGEGGDPNELYSGIFLGITEKNGRRSVDGYVITKDCLKKVPYQKIEFANSSGNSHGRKIQFPGIFYQSGLLKEMGFTPAELNKLYTIGLIPPDADIMDMMGIKYHSKSKFRPVLKSTEGNPSDPRAVVNKTIRRFKRSDLGYQRDRRVYEKAPSMQDVIADDNMPLMPRDNGDDVSSFVKVVESDQILDPEEKVYHELIKWTGDPGSVPPESDQPGFPR